MCGKFGGLIGSFKDTRDKVPFVGMQLQDLFFDRILGNQAIDGDGSRLADPVGTVRGLVFDGRVPPRIEMNHVVGPGQIQSRATDLERDQEELSFTALEGIDALLPLLRRRLSQRMVRHDVRQFRLPELKPLHGSFFAILALFGG